MLTGGRKPRTVRPWQVMGVDVIAPDGEMLGTIEDVVVDKTSEVIRYVVIGIGGQKGRGERFETIPWLDLEFSEEENAFVAPPDKAAALDSHLHL
jgi:sporulation protein YlmC with PRC-barrel domain